MLFMPFFGNWLVVTVSLTQLHFAMPFRFFLVGMLHCVFYLVCYCPLAQRNQRNFESHQATDLDFEHRRGGFDGKTDQI